MSLRGIWRKATSTGKPVLRGRVAKVSITAGGMVSVVVRFGIDEPDARLLDQGSLVELVEVEKAPVKPPKETPP